VRVLVTGHNGFIGKAVAHELMERGHRVCLFTGDVNDPKAVERQVWHNEVVIHLAAKTPGGMAAKFEEFVNVNFYGSLRIAKACEDACIPMIFGATRLREGHYGRSKWMAEEVLTQEYGATPVRVSMAYGPGQVPPPPYGDGKVRLIPTWVCAALSGDVMWVYGDRDTVPDLVYIDDVADAYADMVDELATQRGRRSLGTTPREVAGPGTHTLNDIVRAVAAEVKAQVGLDAIHTHADDGTPGPPSGAAGVGTPLKAGLRRTVLYYRSRLEKIRSERT
jgi:nucleoside-diphosphate-sugar epimerase